MLKFKKLSFLSFLLVLLSVLLVPFFTKNLFARTCAFDKCPLPKVTPVNSNWKKCCYTDGRTSSCFNDWRGDYMCGAWVGGSGRKIGCYETCPKLTPTPNGLKKCCYHDVQRGYWENACFNDVRGDYMCGVWIGGGGTKVSCNTVCPR